MKKVFCVSKKNLRNLELTIRSSLCYVLFYHQGSIVLPEQTAGNAWMLLPEVHSELWRPSPGLPGSERTSKSGVHGENLFRCLNCTTD